MKGSGKGKSWPSPLNKVVLTSNSGVKKPVF